MTFSNLTTSALFINPVAVERKFLWPGTVFRTMIEGNIVVHQTAVAPKCLSCDTPANCADCDFVAINTYDLEEHERN